MRDFLKDINIVGATMVYRCFSVQEYCIKNLVEYCDRVLILLDNYDEQAERKVLEYQKKYPKIRVIYSKYPNSERDTPHGEIYQRFMKNELPIREQIITELHKMNKEEKIDLVLWPDSDECFTKEGPKILTDFWNSDKSLLFTGFINVFNDFKTLSEPTMFSHGRIFKYKSDISVLKTREHGFLYPFLKKDRIKMRYILLHLAYLTKESRESRDFHRDRADRKLKIERLREKASIYVLEKDVRGLTRKEIKVIVTGKRDYSLGEYLDKFNLEY